MLPERSPDDHDFDYRVFYIDDLQHHDHNDHLHDYINFDFDVRHPHYHCDFYLKFDIDDYIFINASDYFALYFRPSDSGNSHRRSGGLRFSQGLEEVLNAFGYYILLFGLLGIVAFVSFTSLSGTSASTSSGQIIPVLIVGAIILGALFVRRGRR